MTERDKSREQTAERAARLTDARRATSLSEVFEALDMFLARIGAHARKRDRQRQVARALANMSDHELRDIDLHRSEILSATHNLDRFVRYDDRRQRRT